MRRDSFALDQRVTSVEELADVTPEVLLEHELATRMELIVAVEVQYKVIKDKKRNSSCHSLVDLFISEDEHLAVTRLLSVFIISSCGWCFDNHVSLGVDPPVEALEQDHEQTETQETDYPQGRELVVTDDIGPVVLDTEHDSQVTHE